jgi:hypothetical protein
VSSEPEHDPTPPFDLTALSCSACWRLLPPTAFPPDGPWGYLERRCNECLSVADDTDASDNRKDG